MSRRPSAAPAGQLPVAHRTNAGCLEEYVQSTLAFHGLRPHVAAQLAFQLSGRAVALEVLPPHLRQLVEQHLRGGSAP